CAQGHRDGTRAAWPVREDRALYLPGAARRSRRCADRTEAHDTVVLQCGGTSEASHRGRGERPNRVPARTHGGNLSLPECTTSSHGASTASSGGAIAPPPGRALTVPSSSPTPRRRQRLRHARNTAVTNR